MTPNPRPRHKPMTSVCTVSGCARLATNRGRCKIHGGTHTGWSSGRDRAAQERSRRAVLERDGYACVDGGSTEDLRACHLTLISEGGGYAPAEGITRCRRCATRTDRWAL